MIFYFFPFRMHACVLSQMKTRGFPSRVCAYKILCYMAVQPNPTESYTIPSHLTIVAQLYYYETGLWDAFYYGNSLGTIFFGPLGDSVGRYRILLVCSICITIFGFISATGAPFPSPPTAPSTRSIIYNTLPKRYK